MSNSHLPPFRSSDQRLAMARLPVRRRKHSGDRTLSRWLRCRIDDQCGSLGRGSRDHRLLRFSNSGRIQTMFDGMETLTDLKFHTEYWRKFLTNQEMWQHRHGRFQSLLGEIFQKPEPMSVSWHMSISNLFQLIQTWQIIINHGGQIFRTVRHFDGNDWRGQTNGSNGQVITDRKRTDSSINRWCVVLMRRRRQREDKTKTKAIGVTRGGGKLGSFSYSWRLHLLHPNVRTVALTFLSFAFA